VLFVLGVYMLVFAAMFGCKNDPVKFILGHAFFSPIAKISFSIYLTHFIVIMRGSFSARIDFYWQAMSSIYIVITDIFYSMILALVLSLLVESPTLGLEKIFLRGGGDKKKSHEISKKDIETLEKSYI
jgi:peptidoglycan/LPS O-acetylase OafA/YrhL